MTFDKNDPLTYFVALGLFTVFLILLAQKSPAIALGLALTVLLAVAFAYEKANLGPITNTATVRPSGSGKVL